ncbi:MULTISPECIES: TetR/AcrR family transcriptional regulator [unclassified Streptomyces]|uniref:TetR/AcrR family transcriptional regulator n=1 Tax=unclassified Streptomyces TaxID=2593676 RepID=UPI002E80CA38|nr:TetR/AcrR family transcriptional regulator [Streptomyces sp. NBC_00589]WTI34105.1 TetR/AcrR family transcriptional regulator [Streptomyces sp. NBC_00775]WUB32222.1 TetR/AcrR family transcriptional regulator [Streptomyces sp. NBC_00589]
MDSTTARDQALTLAREQALDAAEELFYGRGIQTVGMDDIRGASGVSLKRLYQLFPAKERLVEAYLERRDVRWRQRLAEHVDRHGEPEERILAVFDWLGQWFAEPGFRGCAWINSYGELGTTSPVVTAQVTAHKEAFKDYLRGLVADAGLPSPLADQLYLLAEGAMVTAGITRSTETAGQAADAARVLMSRARTSGSRRKG